MRKFAVGMMVLALLGLLAGSVLAGTVEIRRIYFVIDKSDILPASQPVLREVANLLRANPELRITLVGNTCDLESDAYNLALSKRRADSALDYLMNVEGIGRDRVVQTWVGEEDPRFPNTSEENRAKNRRVVMQMYIPSEVAAVVPPAAVPPAADKPAVLAATVVAPASIIRTVTTSVVDANGNFMPGLVANQFVVREAGQRKDIVSVRSAMARINSSVALLLDLSNSICLVDLRDATRDFLAWANPADRFLMVGFDENTEVLSANGSNRDALLNQLNGLERASGTHLYDAVAELSSNQLAARPAPRYLMVFSDGIDEGAGAFGSGSVKSLDQAVAAAKASGVKLITVELGPTTTAGRQTMQALASRTGGQAYVWDHDGGPAQFADIYRTLGTGGLNGTYTIDYRTEENSPATPVVVTSTVGRIK